MLFPQLACDPRYISSGTDPTENTVSIVIAQQYFNYCFLIRCRGNSFVEPLPSKEQFRLSGVMKCHLGKKNGFLVNVAVPFCFSCILRSVLKRVIYTVYFPAGKFRNSWQYCNSALYASVSGGHSGFPCHTVSILLKLYKFSSGFVDSDQKSTRHRGRSHHP